MKYTSEEDIQLLPWYHTEKEKWYVRIKWPDGEQTRHSLGTRIESEVPLAIEHFRQQKLGEIIAVRRATLREPKADIRLADAVQWYVHTHVKVIKGRAAKTVDAYDRILGDFVAYCRMRHVSRPQQLSTRLIQEWQVWRNQYRKAGDSRGAMRDELLCLRQFLNVAQDAGELPSLEGLRWDIPKRQKSRRFQPIDDASLGRFLNDLHGLKPEFYYPVLWMVHTPWLPSDTIDFRVSEDKGDRIDRERIKTGNELGYPITPDLRAIITGATRGRTLRPNDTIFVNKKGEPWTYHELEKKFRYWSEKYNHQFCFRDLRETWATNQAKAGMPPAVLAEMMGHKDPTMALVYYVHVDLPSMIEWQTRTADHLAALRERAAGEGEGATLVPFRAPRKNA